MGSPPILKTTSGFSLSHGGRASFLTIPAFELPTGGIYTLEGPNGSGKSMFVRFLTGTLPGSIDKDRHTTIEIDGNPTPISSYRDARRAGLIGVFQDDDMISSMTFFEYLSLRYSSSSVLQCAHYLWDIIYHWGGVEEINKLRILGPVLPEAARRWLKQIEPIHVDWMNRRALRAKAHQLLRDHSVNSRILDQIPPRMSGGGRAAAKLIAAQMEPTTRVLLLDEAFNSVERNIWPGFVDTIKFWAQQKNAAILAISHNADELVRWDPRGRFEIIDGVLSLRETFEFGVRRRVVRPRQVSVPVFEVASGSAAERVRTYSSLWERFAPIEKSILILDLMAAESSIFKELEAYLPFGVLTTKIALSNDQLNPNATSLASLARRLADVEPGRRAIFIIIGGAILRTLGSFVALISQHFDAAAVVVVPTTFSDAVDAVVSNTIEVAISMVEPSPGTITLSANYSPDAFVLHMDSLNLQNVDELKSGLVKCLRLGVLFDRQLFADCSEALGKNNMTYSEALSLFHRAISTVNEIMELGPHSPGIGRIIKFGDVHAHVIGKQANEAISKGKCLLLGMILEALMTQSENVATALSTVVADWGIILPEGMFKGEAWPAMESLYAEAPGVTGTGDRRVISNLKIDMPGQFSVPAFRSRLAATRGRQNRNLASFANEQAESAIRQVPFFHLRTALPRLRVLCRQLTPA